MALTKARLLKHEFPVPGISSEEYPRIPGIVVLNGYV